MALSSSSCAHDLEAGHDYPHTGLMIFLRIGDAGTLSGDDP